MKPTPTQKKLKRKMIIIRVIGIVLIAFQLLAYLGNIDEPRPTDDTAELVGYYFGYNFFLWVGIIMLIWSFNVGKKLKLVIRDEMVEGIGKNEV
jgi:Na+-driven multidrug efflux pump